MDESSVQPAFTDRSFAAQKPVQQAFADAARAMARARRAWGACPHAEDEAGLRAARLNLAQTRCALVGAAWRP